ncbi:MAG: S8 family serine peptidase [Candidatus Sericytochromatia bacterium]|nr:S8 family serine peptidase [Candidatus Sericytochromatia bacterium]
MRIAVSTVLSACMALTSACAVFQVLPSVSRVSSSGRPNPELVLAIKRISPRYTGPMDLAIDPAIGGRKSSMSLKSAIKPFRLTFHSDGETVMAGFGTLAKDPKSSNPTPAPRHDPWMLHHQTNADHVSSDHGQYFDPNNTTQIGIDPTAGEIPVPGTTVSLAAVSMGGSRSAEYVSAKLTVFPKSQAALTEILRLTGGQVTRQVGDDFYEIAPDLSKADLMRLPDYVRAFSEFTPIPITQANFSSLNMAKTMALGMMLVNEHTDLVQAISLDSVGIPSTPPALDTSDAITSSTYTASEKVALTAQRIPEAWQYGLGEKKDGSRVKIAYIDQGWIDLKNSRELSRTADYEHGISYLFGTITPLPTEFPHIFSNSYPYWKWHGTGCLMAAVGDINNGAGAIGVAPHAKAIPISAYTCNDMSSAIYFALFSGVDVIGSSIAYPSYFFSIATGLSATPFTSGLVPLFDPAPIGWATSIAEVLNVPFVACAGNEYDWIHVNALAAFPSPILVGAVVPPNDFDSDSPEGSSAVTTDWRKVSYSNFGPRVDVWANSFAKVDGDTRKYPDVYADTYANSGQYIRSFTGTSAAAPQVCGAVALMKAAATKAGITLTVSQIRSILKSSGQSSHGAYNIRDNYKSPGGVLQAILPLDSRWNGSNVSILNVERAVLDVLSSGTSAAPNIIRSIDGILCERIEPKQGVDTAKLIVSDGTKVSTITLGEAGAETYGSAEAFPTFSQTGAPSPKKFTTVSVEGWLRNGKISDGLDVYRVLPKSIPPTVASLTLVTGSNTIKATGTFLISNPGTPMTLSFSIAGAPVNLTATHISPPFTEAEFNVAGNPRISASTITTATHIELVTSGGKQAVPAPFTVLSTGGLKFQVSSSAQAALTSLQSGLVGPGTTGVSDQARLHGVAIRSQGGITYLPPVALNTTLDSVIEWSTLADVGGSLSGAVGGPLAGKGGPFEVIVRREPDNQADRAFIQVNSGYSGSYIGVLSASVSWGPTWASGPYTETYSSQGDYSGWIGSFLGLGQVTAGASYSTTLNWREYVNFGPGVSGVRASDRFSNEQLASAAGALISSGTLSAAAKRDQISNQFQSVADLPAQSVVWTQIAPDLFEYGD